MTDQNGDVAIMVLKQGTVRAPWQPCVRKYLQIKSQVYIEIMQ